MQADDLENFEVAKSPILLNPEAATIADVIFRISLGSVEPGPIPREVAMKKNFETSDTYVLEWQQRAGEPVKSRPTPASYILEFEESFEFYASVFYIAGVIEPVPFTVALQKRIVSKKETRHNEVAQTQFNLASCITDFFCDVNSRTFRHELSSAFNVQTSKSKVQPTLQVQIASSVVRFKTGSDYYRFEKLPGRLMGSWNFSEPYADFVEGDRVSMQGVVEGAPQQSAKVKASKDQAHKEREAYLQRKAQASEDLNSLLAEEAMLSADFDRTLEAAFQSEKEEKEKDNEIISQITSVPRPGHSESQLTGLANEIVKSESKLNTKLPGDARPPSKPLPDPLNSPRMQGIAHADSKKGRRNSFGVPKKEKEGSKKEMKKDKAFFATGKDSKKQLKEDKEREKQEKEAKEKEARMQAKMSKNEREKMELRLQNEALLKQLEMYRASEETKQGQIFNQLTTLLREEQEQFDTDQNEDQLVPVLSLGLKELFAPDIDETSGGIWKDNAYSIEHRFQSLVNNLERRGEGDNELDRLTALETLFDTLPQETFEIRAPPSNASIAAEKAQQQATLQAQQQANAMPMVDARALEKQEQQLQYYEDAMNKMMETEARMQSKILALQKALETEDEMAAIQADLLEDHQRIIKEQAHTIEQLKDLVFQQNIKITLLGSENMELKDEGADSFFSQRPDTSKFNSLADYKSFNSVERKQQQLNILKKSKEMNRADLAKVSEITEENHTAIKNAMTTRRGANPAPVPEPARNKMPDEWRKTGNFSKSVLAASIHEEKKKMAPRRGKPAAQPQGGSIGKLEDFQDDYTALPFTPFASTPIQVSTAPRMIGLPPQHALPSLPPAQGLPSLPPQHPPSLLNSNPAVLTVRPPSQSQPPPVSVTHNASITGSSSGFSMPPSSSSRVQSREHANSSGSLGSHSVTASQSGLNSNPASALVSPRGPHTTTETFANPFAQPISRAPSQASELEQQQQQQHNAHLMQSQSSSSLGAGGKFRLPSEQLTASSPALISPPPMSPRRGDSSRHPLSRENTAGSASVSATSSGLLSSGGGIKPSQVSPQPAQLSPLAPTSPFATQPLNASLSGSISAAQPTNPQLLAQAFFPVHRPTDSVQPSTQTNPYVIGSQSGAPISTPSNNPAQPFSYLPNPQSPFLTSQTGTAMNPTMTTTTTYTNPFANPVRALPTTPQQLQQQHDSGQHGTVNAPLNPTNPFASMAGTPTRAPSGFGTPEPSPINPFLTNNQSTPDLTIKRPESTRRPSISPSTNRVTSNTRVGGQ